MKYKKGTQGKLSNPNWGSLWYHIEILGKGTKKGFYTIYYKEFNGMGDEDKVEYSEANLDEFFTEYTKLEKVLL